MWRNGLHTVKELFEDSGLFDASFEHLGQVLEGGRRAEEVVRWVLRVVIVVYGYFDEEESEVGEGARRRRRVLGGEGDVNLFDIFDSAFHPESKTSLQARIQVHVHHSS